MAGYDNGTSFWEGMNICAWIGALLDGIALVDVLLRIYQDYSNGNETSASVTFAVVMGIVLAICIFFIWLSVRHMKKYPHTIWVTFPDFITTFLPFDQWDFANLDDGVRKSQLWKRFGVRFKWGTFCWGLFWSCLVIEMCYSTYRFYQNPYEPDLPSRIVNAFYDTDYVISTCYLRFVVAAIFLCVAIITFLNAKDYLSSYFFGLGIREWNVSYEELNQEFVDATYYGNHVWCGKRFLFVRSESDGAVISYDKIQSMEIMRTHGEVLLFLKVPQWTLMITDEKGEEFVTSSFRVKPYRDVVSVWKNMQIED